MPDPSPVFMSASTPPRWVMLQTDSMALLRMSYDGVPLMLAMAPMPQLSFSLVSEWSEPDESGVNAG